MGLVASPSQPVLGRVPRVWRLLDLLRGRKAAADQLRARLGDRRVLVTDDECVDEPGDYRSVVDQLCDLTDGALRFGEVGCEERDGVRELTLRRGDRAWRALLDGHTAWVDRDPLLDALNQAAADLGLDRRFATFESGAGQASGYAWVAAEELDPQGPALTIRPTPRWRPTPLHGHPGPGDARGLAVSPDGRLVATSGGSALERFDLAELRRLERTPVDHPQALGFDADGELLIGTLRGLVSRGRRLGDRVIVGISVDATRRLAALAALEHPDLDPPAWVEVWDLAAGARRAQWSFDVGTLTVALSPDGERVVAASETGRMGLWTADGTSIGEREWDDCLLGLAFRPDGGELVVGPERGPVARVSASTAGVVGHLEPHGGWSLAWGPHGLAVGGASGVQLVRDGVAEWVWQVPPDGPGVTHLAWLPDGGLVGVTEGRKGRAQVWRWR
jgi:hypothetical protein